jgi:hypothetical protein
MTMIIGKRLGWSLTGKKSVFIVQSEKEDKQMSIKSANKFCQTKMGERKFLDIGAAMPNKHSDTFAESLYKRYWRILVDESSQF